MKGTRRRADAKATEKVAYIYERIDELMGELALADKRWERERALDLCLKIDELDSQLRITN